MTNEQVINFVENQLSIKIERIEKLHGGMMNESYSFEDSNGNAYIAYFPTEEANKLVNRKIEKESIEIANSLTSKNIYFNEETGIKINEFIKGCSLDKTNEFDYDKVAKLLKAFHSSTKKQSVPYNPFKRFLEYEKNANKYNKEINYEYEKLRAFTFENQRYLESQELVNSHNDAQRSNVIKSDDNNYYLIDFEFVGLNDEIYDIATFGNGSVSEGRELLNHYFESPTNEQIKRYYIWRVFISLQWYNVAIAKHYQGEGEIHHFNFLNVADHFLLNAKEAFAGYNMEKDENLLQQQTERLIEQTLDKIRHFLQKDGGDVEFVSFKDGVVTVKMSGACQDCAYAGADIKELVEVILQEEVPGVVEVRAA